MKRSRDEDRETKASQKKLAALPKSDKSALKSKSPTSSTRPVANIITSDPSKAAKSGKTSESMDGKGKKSSKDNKAIKTSSSKGDAIGKDRKKKFGESDPDLGDFDIDIDAIFGEIKDKKLARQMEEKEEEERQRAELELKEKYERRVAQLEKEGKKANRVRGEDSPIPLRFDTDMGLNIYNTSSLKLGKGGGTPLCPIDCNCCF